MMSVDDKIADIRERLAKMEATLEMVQKSVADMACKGSGGNIVVPVTAVIVVLEIVKVFVERVV